MLIDVMLVLIVVGVMLWLVNSVIPMDGTIKKVINVVAIVAVVVWLLKVFGLWSRLFAI